MLKKIETVIAVIIVIAFAVFGYTKVYETAEKQGHLLGYNEGYRDAQKESGTMPDEEPTMELYKPQTDGVFVWGSPSSTLVDSAYTDGYNAGYNKALDDNNIVHEKYRFRIKHED